MSSCCRRLSAKCSCSRKLRSHCKSNKQQNRCRRLYAKCSFSRKLRSHCKSTAFVAQIQNRDSSAVSQNQDNCTDSEPRQQCGLAKQKCSNQQAGSLFAHGCALEVWVERVCAHSLFEVACLVCACVFVCVCVPVCACSCTPHPNIQVLLHL